MAESLPARPGPPHEVAEAAERAAPGDDGREDQQGPLGGAVEVRQAAARLRQAEREATVWREKIVPEAEAAVKRSESAYRNGDAPLLVMLVNTRQLLTSRQRLIDAGKPKMVATIAVARKLLTILNAIMREQKPWQSA